MWGVNKQEKNSARMAMKILILKGLGFTSPMLF
jgi:hypothetical protein